MKQYQGEKAIISLTSWKARIKTVGLTIYSLLKNCPGFHIVLCLSEEEFPAKEAELPDDINLLANCNKIEILWVYKNYKAFKKILFTMDKYRDVPIISADDDIAYNFNYAELLYADFTRNKTMVAMTATPSHVTGQLSPWGYATLHPPGWIPKLYKQWEHVIDLICKSGCFNDDFFISILWYMYNTNIVRSLNMNFTDVCFSHTPSDYENSLTKMRIGSDLVAEAKNIQHIVEQYK